MPHISSFFSAKHSRFRFSNPVILAKVELYTLSTLIRNTLPSPYIYIILNVKLMAQFLPIIDLDSLRTHPTRIWGKLDGSCLFLKK